MSVTPLAGAVTDMAELAEDSTLTQQARDEHINRLAWFLTGALIGATVAILYAPKPGKDTRRYLSDRAQASKDAVTGTTNDIVESGREMFERGRRMVDDAAALFDRARKMVRGE